MTTAAVKLPNELFKIMIETEILPGQDLKSIRLVCHAFMDFSTPLLFREISFSVTKENLEAFTSIAGNRGLNKHVRIMTVDATRPVPLNPRLHILEAARNCDLWLNLLCQCGNMRDDIEGALIQADIPACASDVGSMTAQSALIPGFALHQARAEFWSDTVMRDGIFSALVQGFLNFENLTSVSLTTKWTKNDERLEAAWESKGNSTSQSLVEAIKVLNSNAAQQTQPVETGYFSGPGPSARNLEFFHPFPRASPYSIQTSMRALCRALAISHRPLECLVLPQDWELGEDVDIPLESFFSYQEKKPPTLSDFKTTFSQLRYLDIHIDTSTARAGVGWNGDLFDTGSFSNTIRCMREIQTLCLDFVSNDIFGLDGLEIGIQEAFGIFEIEELLGAFSDSGATAIIPNPWPNLKHLTLCGISSMWEEYLILLNTISPTLSTLDLQEARVSRGLKLAVEWANLVSGMRRQLSTLETLTLRPEAADEWTLMAELKHLTGEEVHEGSLGEEMEEHILHGAKNPLLFWLPDDEAKREGEEVEWED